MSKIDLTKLSASERNELMQQLKDEQKKQKGDRETYKIMVDEVIPKFFNELVETSTNLAAQKRRVIDGFKDLIFMKCQLYDIDPNTQLSHTFSNLANTMRVTLGYYTVDAYDDTVTAGVQKVKDYLGSLKSEDAKIPVQMVNKLLSKDNAGNLKAQRVLQLAKIAEESGNVQFIDAVQIIQDAYCPVKSKQYIRCEFKNKDNKWVSVPLGLTEVDIEVETKQ